MTNLEIASHFSELASLMELHRENPFKIRTYQNVNTTLKKMSTEVADMSAAELAAIKGFGAAVQDKIRQLNETGEMSTLKKYQDMTPPGIRELVKVRGLGPKKIRVLWKDLGVESIGELLYAINENRLIELNGFGLKTQSSIKEKLEYFNRQRHKYRYASLEPVAMEFWELIKALTDVKVKWSGALRRRAQVIDKIELVVEHGFDNSILNNHEIINVTSNSAFLIDGMYRENYSFEIHIAPESLYYSFLAKMTGSDTYSARLKDIDSADSEEEVFLKSGLTFWPPELREEIHFDQKFDSSELIKEQDIKGVIHAHSTYSDGFDSLKALALHCKKQGFTYLGITDHSQSAVYAQGLSIESLEKQWDEINQLNQAISDFQILKGIESDILNDGSLDYPPEVLSSFDFIIASIHSVLNMDIERATSRVIKAIENPYTSIIGHPTGRLLLARPGYPLDFEKIIDACAANDVSIELNANPYRLDMDWSHIPMAVEKGVMISINPDAHSMRGVEHIKYGVLAARKGGLYRSQCLNTLEVDQFLKQLKK